jgi:hypothetical protein
MANFAAGNYKTVAVSVATVSNISANPASMAGIFVSSSTGAGTVAIFDDGGTGTSVTVIPAFTPNITICWYPVPVQTRNGICVSVGAATITYTVFWD